jgi:hypothetical protein
MTVLTPGIEMIENRPNIASTTKYWPYSSLPANLANIMEMAKADVVMTP